MLDGMRNLQRLNLRKNSLKTVDKEALTPLRQLTTLDLAANEIKTIQKVVFQHIQIKLYRVLGHIRATYEAVLAGPVIQPTEVD